MLKLQIKNIKILTMHRTWAGSAAGKTAFSKAISLGGAFVPICCSCPKIIKFTFKSIMIFNVFDHNCCILIKCI